MRSNANSAVGLFTAVALTVVLCSATHAQEPTEPQGYRVREIQVVGADSSTVGAIRQYSGIRVGDILRLNSDVLQKAVRGLMQRGVYSNVTIYFANIDQTSGNVTVVIEVRQQPRIGQITISGNDAISSSDLRESISIRDGSVFSPYELSRSIARIKAAYAKEGYLGASVGVDSATSAETGRLDIGLNVDEGPEVRVSRIEFKGNTRVSSSDLLGAMEDVSTKSWWEIWRSSKFERDGLDRDVGRIQAYYRSVGYVDATAAVDTVDIDPSTGNARITIAIVEGKEVVLRSISITGNSAYSTDQIRRRLDVEEGVPYNQTLLEQNLNGNAEQTDVRSLYYDNGYLQFNAAVTETRNSTGDSVDVVIAMVEGTPSTIRFVTIKGNTKTKDKVIRRELYTRPGDVFSRAAVIRSLRSLANLNYFNPEKLQPDIRPTDATHVDVTYQVEERPSDTFNASIGLSSQGLTGLLGVSFNNFAVSEPLLGGGGQVLNFNWEFGTYQSTFALGWTEPWLFDDPTSLGANVFVQTRDVASLSSSSSYKLRQWGGSLNVGRRLRWPDDYFRIDGGISGRKNDLEGETTSLYYRNGTEVTLSLSLSRSSIDNPIFPTVGSRFVFSNTIAGLGNAEYVKSETKFDFYSPLAHVTENNPLVFYLGNELGYLYDYGPIQDIPPLAFYSMGGTAIGALNVTPLRGYRDGSIGPVDANGIAVGQVYSKLTAELRFGVSLNPIPIYLLAFAEAGNVWQKFAEVDPYDVKRSAGIGVRLTIPGVGLLGFDYGYGFDRDTFGVPGGWQFHFQFGR